MRTALSGFCLLSLLFVLAACGGSAGGNTVPATAANMVQQRAMPQSAFRTLAALSDAFTVTEFPIKREANYSPGAITEGPDGAMWFIWYVDPDFGVSYIDRIAPGGQITGFAFAAPALTFPGPQDLVTGPDGALWITDEGDNAIVRMTTRGNISTYQVPGLNPGPVGIASGPDGALWFTEVGDNAIARITTSGAITTYKRGLSPEANLQDICVGPDGNLWFTEYAGNRIGRITTAGVITEFSTGLDPNSQPYAIASDSQAIWFTQYDEIGRIDPQTGLITEYPLAVPYGERPDGIAATPDEHVWYIETGKDGAMIGSIAPNKRPVQYTAGITPKSHPIAIAAGPHGTLWFTQLDDQVGRVMP
jgi:streptogramin lyase